MEVAPVTLETFDPLVVQVEAAIVIVTVSTGLVPLFCSGGSNVTVPVPEQLMPPVATVGALVDELVDVELLVASDVEVDVEVDVEAVVGLWLLEQADMKTKETTRTTPATARDRSRNENRIRGIVCRSLGSIQGLSSHETRTPGPRVQHQSLTVCRRGLKADSDDVADRGDTERRRHRTRGSARIRRLAKAARRETTKRAGVAGGEARSSWCRRRSGRQLGCCRRSSKTRASNTAGI
ncbi:MAG: hypothetical protein ABSB54_19635 [Acidimicrobiales bacterium]